ncbi:hypothetical protein V6N11_076012 [Hibiscus sabdariffa]|uniref:CASP-like protein n=1 Tax=Hibiscus sabdariffa TaxID=183260 RepID=A0ABR2Q4Z7_9ROSI
MAVVLAMVVDGLGLFVKTLWGMQERRFSATFDAVSSAAISITMAFVQFVTLPNNLVTMSRSSWIPRCSAGFEYKLLL